MLMTTLTRDASALGSIKVEVEGLARMVGELSRSQKSSAGEFGRDAHEKRPKDNEFARADEYFEIILVSSSRQYFEYVYVCY